MAFLGPRFARGRRRLALAAAGLLAAAPLLAQTPPSREYQIKAAFLYNFAQFVEWPPQAFPSPDSPLAIGVLGDDPFDGALDRTLRGEVLHGHRVEVHRSRGRRTWPAASWCSSAIRSAAGWRASSPSSTRGPSSP